jgi:NitT/TauT family transport system substrate-binding protein
MKPRRIVQGSAVVLYLVLLVFFRYRALHKPRPHTEEDYHVAPVGGRQTLTVAFIPVTCHLTCPVTDYASKTSTTGTRFDAMRFGEFPSIVEALKTKKLLAGFVTVPLAMKMREQGAPIRICCLGHRDGSQLTIRKEDPAKDLRDMRGKTIAIPSPFSNENFLVNKLMRDQGVGPDEIKFVVLPPPDMPAALSARAIDGFVVAEPFCGKAEMEGYGRVLYYAKDVWPNYISCCLVVHTDLIAENPEVVRDLVRGIIASGEWATKNRDDAAKLVSPYFGQSEKLMRYVLTQPPDRVTFVNLNPTDLELQRIMDMGLSLGQFKKATPIDQIIDRRFIAADIPAATIDLTRMSEIIDPTGTSRTGQ